MYAQCTDKKGGEEHPHPQRYGNCGETPQLRREKLKNPRLIADYAPGNS